MMMHSQPLSQQDKYHVMLGWEIMENVEIKIEAILHNPRYLHTFNKLNQMNLSRDY